MAEEVKRVTFPELQEEINKIFTNTTNLLTEMGAMAGTPPFDDEKSLHGLKMMTMNASNMLIAEQIVEYLKGEPSNILISKNMPPEVAAS